MIRVLVTGVGAVIGYGIIKSLRQSGRDVHIVGTDIFEDAVGQHWCDEFVQSLPAADVQYPEFLRSIVRGKSIDIVFPGIEQDIFALNRARNRLDEDKCKYVLNERQLIEDARDKWRIYSRLKEEGFPCIETRIEGQFDDFASILGNPFLIKPRRSYASKGIVRVQSERELSYWRTSLGDNFMVQEIVGDDDSEYTVGAFCLPGGTVHSQIIMKRKLSGEGATAKAKVVDQPELKVLVEKLALVFLPVGPTNFQFRYHKGEFLLLEINPRISSSTSLRTAFGFNEAEMSLQYYLEGKVPSLPDLRYGHAARFIEDYVVYDRDCR